MYGESGVVDESHPRGLYHKCCSISCCVQIGKVPVAEFLRVTAEVRGTEFLNDNRDDVGAWEYTYLVTDSVFHCINTVFLSGPGIPLSVHFPGDVAGNLPLEEACRYCIELAIRI